MGVLRGGLLLKAKGCVKYKTMIESIAADAKVPTTHNQGAGFITSGWNSDEMTLDEWLASPAGRDEVHWIARYLLYCGDAPVIKWYLSYMMMQDAKLLRSGEITMYDTDVMRKNREQYIQYFDRMGWDVPTDAKV